MTAEITENGAVASLLKPRYTSVAIALHWAIALLIVGLLTVGWVMDALPGGPGSPKTAIIQLHKSLGITVLLLTIARIIWRVMNPPPPGPSMPALQKLLAGSVHVLLYAVMLLMPLSGWIMASAEIDKHETLFFGTTPFYAPGVGALPAGARESLAEVSEAVHHNLAWLLAALLALHVAAALKHQFVDRDSLLARMAPGLLGRTSGPVDKGQGAAWAFGAAALVFAGVTALSVATSSSAAPASDITPDQQPASQAPVWIVDPSKSSILFKSAYMGRAFEGRFPDWTAEVQLDTDAPPNPERPVDGYVRVRIPTGKVSTGEPYFDENVTQGDWFDSAKHPEAVFEVRGGIFKLSATAYEATGVLTLKGVDYPVRLPFTLTVNGASAVMHGEVSLKRLALGVGADTPAVAKGDAEWVQDDVAVIIDVTATRQ